MKIICRLVLRYEAQHPEYYTPLLLGFVPQPNLRKKVFSVTSAANIIPPRVNSSSITSCTPL